ncbi:hypothetical protein [Pseudoduganella lutea]|uniref:Uncharacterized protein n=1 Tax=Pseudoduganella lutea TaxID=321985 RepID=A0A4P6L1H1_9BURK|nr:hypothetical protein [Pseudoduganella lutea]QBE64722.1 hypothetical protein EWM63_18440 [Pseudoduganella lutea]
MNKRFLMVLLAAFVSAPTSAANDTAAAPAVQNTRQASGSLVIERPYSAIQTVTIRRLLADGDEFTRQTVTRLYRDSAGRTRRDTLDGDGELDHSVITGADGATIFLDHKNELISGGGAGRQAPALDREAGQAPASPAGRARAAAVEQLGQRDIEGVTATGRITRHPAGRDGEDIEVTSEVWYAEELKLALYRKHSDPRFGESTIELSELDRSEPDPALFEAPEDYKLLTSHFRRN